MRGMIAIFSVSHFSWMSVCVCACIVYSHFGVIRSHFHGIHKGIYYRNYLVRLWVGGWLRVYALLLHLFKHKKFIIFSAEIFHVSRQQRVRISFTCSLARSSNPSIDFLCVILSLIYIRMLTLQIWQFLRSLLDRFQF